jgi:hypothetical protein
MSTHIWDSGTRKRLKNYGKIEPGAGDASNRYWDS